MQPLRARAPGTVHIEDVASLGTGVVLRGDGLIVTYAHVVGETTGVTVVTSTGVRLEARVLARDPGEDLALVLPPRLGRPVRRDRGDTHPERAVAQPFPELRPGPGPWRLARRTLQTPDPFEEGRRFLELLETIDDEALGVHEEYVGDALHRVGPCQVRVYVQVDKDHLDTLQGLCHLRVRHRDGLQLFAWCAPLRPEVDDDGSAGLHRTHHRIGEECRSILWHRRRLQSGCLGPLLSGLHNLGRVFEALDDVGELLGRGLLRVIGEGDLVVVVIP